MASRRRKKTGANMNLYGLAFALRSVISPTALQPDVSSDGPSHVLLRIEDNSRPIAGRTEIVRSVDVDHEIDSSLCNTFLIIQ